MARFLEDRQLSAIYQTADKLSGSGQKRTKAFVRLELCSLIVAAATGIAPLRIGDSQLDILAAVSAIFFLLSLTATVCRSFIKPERDWYRGRAAAESIRTLAWRYALGGDPFPTSMNPRDAEDKFLDRVRMVLGELKEMDLPPHRDSNREITPQMQTLRTANLTTRRDAYKRDRIEDQIAWYMRRAGDHRRLARTWLTITILASFAGLVGASLKFVGVFSLDLLGVAAACASAAIAWNQLNQHRMQATAYVLTARELNIIRERVDKVEDAQWALFVSDSEDAISREHVMWAARHGHPMIRVI